MHSVEDEPILVCPECGCGRIFVNPIILTTSGIVCPDGSIDEDSGGEWSWLEDSDANCAECGFVGTVVDFV